MTSNALGQSFLLEMALIFGDRRMACQAIGEAQERPAMRLMAGATFILHRPMFWKRFSFERHARMAAQTGFFLGFQSLPVVLGGKLVASRAMKCLHAADIRARFGMTSGAFRRGFDRVERR